VSRRKSIAISAAGLLAVVALVAGCVSSPLTDVHKILSDATTSLGNLQSVHFHLEAGGQFLFGVEALPSSSPTPTESPSPSATPTPTPTATAAASGSAKASGSARAGGSPTATPTPTPTPTPSPSPSPSPTPSPTLNPSISPSPTPTPLYTAFPISLNGTVADGDIDFTNKTAHIVGGLPGIPGYSGELIVVDPYAYYRAYGQTTYQVTGDSSLTVNPVDSSLTLYFIQQIVAVANDPGLSPVLVGAENEPGGLSYHIRVDVTQSALNSKLQSLQTVQALGNGQINLWITESGFELERLEFSTTDPHAGTAAVRLLLSNWNGVGPITAPPANQMNNGASPS
jgi:hypothetical protein